MPRISLKMMKDNNAIIIDAEEAVHIGRSEKIKWANLPGRTKPAEFDDLEKALVIPAGDISRNHCALVPDSDGQFYLIDMDSRNGTYLNGERLAGSSVHAKLEGGDVFSVGAIQFYVEYPDQKVRNFGLLLGHEGWTLRGVRQDLEMLSAELCTRGFQDDLRLWMNHDASKDAVLGFLKQLAPQTTRNSHIIFHYSGHGSSKGLCLGSQTVSPRELYEHLGPVQGKKALFLDCCHAGIFLESPYCHDLPNSLIVAATARDDYAYEAPAEVADGKWAGVMSAEVTKYFKAHPSHFDLLDMKEALEKDLPAGKYSCMYQHPIVHGAGFTVLSINPNNMDLVHSQMIPRSRGTRVEDSQIRYGDINEGNKQTPPRGSGGL